jgi:hypothetical protein
VDRSVIQALLGHAHIAAPASRSAHRHARSTSTTGLTRPSIFRCAKATGIEHLPSKSYELNQAWCVAAMNACHLLCWLRLLCLDGPLATAEPKTLRYRLLHTAVRLVRGQRKRKIKIAETWPWARELHAFEQLRSSPLTGGTSKPAAEYPRSVFDPPQRHTLGSGTSSAQRRRGVVSLTSRRLPASRLLAS